MGDETAFEQLERVELAARERRLVAETEASGILESARERARAIEDAVPATIQRELRAAARRSRARTSRALAAVDQELRAVEESAASAGELRRSGDSGDERGFDAAVRLVVAAVLGEREG